VQLVHIPFKGGGPAMVALLSGEVPITFGTAASVSPQTKVGKLRALGVTSGKRSAVLPDIPTIAEGGLPGYEMLNWLGLFAPAGTPRVIVDRLAAESLRVLQQPEVVQRFHAQGAEPSPLGTDEFAAFVKREIEKWSRVVAATGMRAD
jgi:tripartite-type tricarboxylate transporter receptor subunit TctC